MACVIGLCFYYVFIPYASVRTVLEYHVGLCDCDVFSLIHKLPCCVHCSVSSRLLRYRLPNKMRSKLPLYNRVFPQWNVFPRMWMDQSDM